MSKLQVPLTDENAPGGVRTKFPIAEFSQLTIQGEGPLVGIPCIFVRFGGCDYRCSFCDSMHAVKPDLVRQLPQYTAGELFDRIQKLLEGTNVNWVVLTGGNPVLYDLYNLVIALKRAGRQVAVETQGTRWKGWVSYLDSVVVSPKPPSAQLTIPQQDSQMKRIQHFFEMYQTPNKAAIKIPVGDARDVEWAGLFFASIKADLTTFGERGWPELFLSMVTQPEDTRQDIADRFDLLLPMANRQEGLEGIRFFPQLHAMLWLHEKER